MRLVLFIFILGINLSAFAQNPLSAIGQWRGHYDNHSIRNIVIGDELYAASPFQIIKFDSNNRANWIDKSNGLHDINITHLAWDALHQQLVVVYANGNIDILKGDQVYNINAIQATTLYPDHKINSIHIYNQWALLATDFGIVVLDLIKHEIKDNWYPNNFQQATRTYDLVLLNESLYTTTENGVWVSDFKNNWILPNQWQHKTEFDSLHLQKLTQQNGMVYAWNASSLYQLPNTQSILQLANAGIENIDTSSHNLNISIQYPNQKGALIQLNKDNSISTLIDSNILASPMQSLMQNNHYWIADSSNGLLLKTNINTWMQVGGPSSSLQGTAFINENALLAPFGNDHIGFAQFDNTKWENITQWGNTKLPPLNAATQSNLDESKWFTSNSAMVHLINNNAQIAFLQPNNFAGNYKSIQLDQNNAIWAVQDQQGLVRQNKSIWNSIALPSGFSQNGLDQFIVNNQGQAWLIAPNQQGIYVYQSKDNYSTELWKQLNTQTNNGNLPSMNVKHIAMDLTGSIWVGTDNGIAIFNCGDIAAEACNAYVPIVNNNGFNGYLFQHEEVHSIAIDGDNRKWIGTNNGCWLLSVDGLAILAHFTKANSPLPSDTILQILIAPTTGEVFFNTTQQMVSYRGTATKGTATQSNIQIFPNPIATNYNGTIAIRGLVENALVKITDLAGRLVYQTTALGGQAIWNGRSYEGHKPATGIYLVFVRDNSGTEKAVGKLMVVDGN